MDQPPDFAITSWIFDHLWAPIIAVVGGFGKVIHGSLIERIKSVREVAEEALPKERFEQHLEDMREYRRLREDTDRRLFDKIDDLKDLITQRIK